MEQNKNLSVLEQNIGYKFKNINLLKNALRHTSYAYEHKIASNEKLEFLGDSILEFLSSKYIYNNYPNLKEGEMTKVRATVVCEDSLYKIAEKHKILGMDVCGEDSNWETAFDSLDLVKINEATNVRLHEFWQNKK